MQTTDRFSNIPDLRHLKPQTQLYCEWLLEKVLVEGYTTLWCARRIGENPEDVLYDLNLILDNSMEEGQ